MKYLSAMLVVEDMERSKRFYTEVLGQKVTMDLGANLSFEGFALQTKETWMEFIDKAAEDIRFGGNQMELYFEVEDFESEVAKVKEYGVTAVREVVEHPWGQRVFRFYDPDRHVIELGESMIVVCKRFLDQGLSIGEVCERTMMPMPFVQCCQSGEMPKA